MMKAHKQPETPEVYTKRVALGMTINMGNYETIRVDVAVESSLLPGETPEDLKKRISEEAANDLVSIAADFKGSINDIKESM